MYNSEKKEVLKTALKMEAKCLIEGTAGNISRRITAKGGKQLIAITPSSTPYDELSPRDIMIVDFSGNIIEGSHRPSIETPLHAAIYTARPDINAIVHAHPAFCSVAAVSDIAIPPILDEQVIYLGSEIRVSRPALPGTVELAQNVVTALGENMAVIMANHGALSVGKDLRQAFTNCELMEKAAKVFIFSKLAGKVNQVQPYILQKELEIFHRSRGK